MTSFRRAAVPLPAHFLSVERFRMKKYRFPLLALVTILIAGLLTSCSGATTISTYPGVTATKDVAYLAEQTGVFALNTQNGTMLWRFPDKADNAKLFYAPPVLVGDQVIVGDYTNNLYSVKTAKGEVAWTYAPGVGHIVAAPLLVNDTVLAPSADHSLYALNAADGSLRWKFQSGNVLWATPASDGKMIYLPGMDHVLYALKFGDGTKVWSKDLGSSLQGSPALGKDGSVYVVTMENKVVALDSNSGAIRWQTDSLGGQVWSTPILQDNTLYYGSANGKVYAVSTETSPANRVIWALDLGSPVIGGGALLKDGLIFPTEDGSAYGVSFKGEKTSLKITVNGKLYSTPVITGDLILLPITQGDKAMRAFDLTGTEKWSFELPK